MSQKGQMSGKRKPIQPVASSEDEELDEFLGLVGKENDGSGLTAEEKLLQQIFGPPKKDEDIERTLRISGWHKYVSYVTVPGGKCEYCGKYLPKATARKEKCPLRPIHE